MSHRESTKKALENFYAKDLKKHQPKRKNKTPEKTLVQEPCIDWARSQGWDIQIFESKATLDGRGNWRNSHIRSGNSDAQGSLPDGIGCYIEFKAPGRRGSLRSGQRKFLREKITANTFAVVVDSLADLQKQYETWRMLRDYQGLTAARQYLFDKLPEEKSEPDLDLK